MPGSLCCTFFAIPLWIVAIGAGIYSIQVINNSQGRNGGKGLAIAGIVCGGLGVATFVLALVFGLGSAILSGASGHH